MKHYLLDTHIFIWAVLDPGRLSRPIKKVLEDRRSVLFISAATLWEMAFLLETKPREMNTSLALATWINQSLQQLQVQVLAITPEHAQRHSEIQPLHKDLFDRMIIAQAASVGLVVLSDDRNFPKYPITVLANE